MAKCKLNQGDVGEARELLGTAFEEEKWVREHKELVKKATHAWKPGVNEKLSKDLKVAFPKVVDAIPKL